MKAPITVSLGNIVNQPDCDAIVNATNENLRDEFGVCGAIHIAAGHELEPYSTRHAPLMLGQAVITPGFRLPNRWVIHVRSPRYHSDPDPAVNLKRAIESALHLAEQNGMKRIAIPAISMGDYAYPPAEAVPIIVGAAIDALRDKKSVQEVRFVLIQAGLAHQFRQALRTRR